MSRHHNVSFIIFIDGLPPLDWKQLKDWARHSCNPTRAEVSGDQFRGPNTKYHGLIKVKKREDAENCYNWLCQHGYHNRYPLRLSFWNITEGLDSYVIKQNYSDSQETQNQRFRYNIDNWFSNNSQFSFAPSPPIQFLAWQQEPIREVPQIPPPVYPLCPAQAPTSSTALYHQSWSSTPCGSQRYAIGSNGHPINVTKAEPVYYSQKQIFIKGLDSRITEEALRERLKRIGHVESCVLHSDRRNQKSKATATVTFSTTEEAMTAIEKLNGSYWNRNRLDVSWEKNEISVSAGSSRQPTTRGSSGRNRKDDPLIVDGS